MHIRPYDPNKDKAAAIRIWNEVGWGGPTENKCLETALEHAHSHVAEITGQAECLVDTIPGDIDYLGEKLPLCAVLGVTTSHVARQGGVAGKLTAHSIAQEVAAGALMAGLGIFDQGYYNRLGFGNGTMEHQYLFDPRALMVPRLTRPPVRLGKDDIDRMHAARINRTRRHGSLSLHEAGIDRSEWAEHNDAFALGFEDEHGELTHFFAMKGLGSETGPVSVRWAAWRTGQQFMELMSMLHSLGDQLHAVRMQEPPGIQLFDLMRYPLRDIQRTSKSAHPTGVRAFPWWQLRMCNIEGCLAKTHLPAGEVRFNLELHDPIEDYLPADAPWRGESGQYIVTLGERSSAQRGADPTLPTMKAGVGAFTRMWLGVRPAWALAITDELQAPGELLASLDSLLRLPQPHLDWMI